MHRFAWKTSDELMRLYALEGSILADCFQKYLETEVETEMTSESKELLSPTGWLRSSFL